MIKILPFKKFLKENFSFNSDESFLEKYEHVVLEFEKKLEKELKFDSKMLWENLTELDKEIEFEEALHKLSTQWYEDLYLGDYNKEYGDHETTPEYDKVIDSVTKKLPLSSHGSSANLTIFRKREELIKDNLMRNCIEKNWDLWKNEYVKWIDYVEKKRGAIFGRRYGL